MAKLEIEIKLATGDLSRIRAAGFDLRPEQARHFEDNWLLDTSDQTLLKRGAALRLRSALDRKVLTYKGPVQSGDSPIKIREEIEFEASGKVDSVIDLFERLGYKRAFRYQKYRTGYRLRIDGIDLQVVLDETPMGDFIEIEGNEAAVRRIITESGFRSEEVVKESYPELQAARCRDRGLPLEDLVFEQG